MQLAVEAKNYMQHVKKTEWPTVINRCTAEKKEKNICFVNKQSAETVNAAKDASNPIFFSARIWDAFIFGSRSNANLIFFSSFSLFFLLVSFE